MKALPVFVLACFFAGPAVADTLPVSIVRIVVDPSTPATLYAAAGASLTAQGVYKSTDAGLTWTLVFSMADAPRDLAIDPLTPSTLYVADPAANLASAIYKSTDGGASWSQAGSGIQQKPGIPGQEDVIDKMAVDPVDEGVVYAASANTGLYKSIDGGQNWTRINQGLPTPIVSGVYTPTGLIVDPVIPATVYLSLFGTVTGEGLYESTDSGATWDLIAFSGQVVSGLIMDPNDHLHLVACLGAFESSTDGGATWTSGASCGSTGVDVIAIDPYYSEHILVADYADKTISPSTDGGATLGAATLSGKQVTGLVFDPEVPANIYAATMASGLYISRDDGTTWASSVSAADRAALIHVPADQSTIQAGIDAAPNADYVVVAPGTYTEQLDFKGKLITVKSSGGAAVTILDGNNTGPIASFHSGEGNAAALRGFTLTHASNSPGAGSAVLITGSSPSIEDDVFTANQEDAGTGSAISGSGTSALILRDYFTGNTCGTNPTDAVVSFTSDASPVVADDVFANNPCAAYAQTIAAATASQVYNDTFVGNTEALRLPGYAVTDTGVTFTQNIIAFNHVGVDTPSYSGSMPVFTFNLVYGDTIADYSGPKNTDPYYNISADPLFVDWTHGDFHLQWDSPAIAAGNSPELDSGFPVVSQASATDFYGQPGIFFIADIPTVDLGAAEFHPLVIDAVAGSLQTSIDTPQTGTMLASGTDPAGPLFFSVVTRPAHGALTYTDPTQATGGFRYVPAAGYLGTDSFTFDVTDPYGIVSNTATEQVTVADAAPTATGGSASTTLGSAVSGTLSATPAYTGQTLTFGLVSQPAHGTMSLTAGTGKFKYTPAAGFVGADSFTFQVTDQYGTASNTATEQVTIVDPAPTASSGSVSTTPDIAVVGILSATPGLAWETLTFSLVAQPAHGSVSLTAGTGKFSYTPATGFAGADSFTFEVKDAYGAVSNVATETVTVNDIAPKANAVAIRVMPKRVTSGILKAVTAYSGQTLTFSVVGTPRHGSVTITNPGTGAYTFTAAPGSRGGDSFTFKVTDQWGTVSNVATVSVLVL